MNEKPFQEITIKEISDRADLVRQTIYRNFKSKEDILEHHINDIYNDFYIRISTKNDIGFDELLLFYFTFWADKKEFLKQLIDNNVFNILLNVHLKYIDILSKNKQIKRIIDAKDAYFDYFSAGGLWFLLKKWIDDDLKKSPQEMTNLVLKFYEKNHSYE